MNKLPASFIGVHWDHGQVESVSKHVRNTMTDDDVPEDIRKRFAALPEDGWPFIDPAFNLLKQVAPEGSRFTQSYTASSFGFKADE